MSKCSLVNVVVCIPLSPDCGTINLFSPHASFTSPPPSPQLRLETAVHVVGTNGTMVPDMVDYDPPTAGGASAYHHSNHYHRQQSPLSTIPSKSPPTSTDSLEHAYSSGVDSPLNQSTSDLSTTAMYTSSCELTRTYSMIINSTQCPS